MGSMIIVFLFLGLFVTILVTQLCAALRTHYRNLPWWLPAVLVVVILLAFALIPHDSMAAVKVFGG